MVPTNKEIAVSRTVATDRNFSDEELLRRVRAKLVRLEPILLGDDDDGLRSTITSPLLKSAIEDLKAIAARLS
jgi:hypothetical protein